MNFYIYKSLRQSHSIHLSLDAADGQLITDTPLHMHPRGEVHFLLEGHAEYIVDTQVFSMEAGDLLFIPKDVLHASKAADTPTRLYAFPITLDVEQIVKITVPQPLMAGYRQAAQSARASGDPDLLTPWLMCLVGTLSPESFCKAEACRDDVTVILDYITTNYNRDITLADAAAVTGLSQRQIQRLIHSDTGHTFRQQLTEQRMVVAAHLMDTSGMSLEEIAEYVGYRSYSGFWKAWQRYRKK